ncbi:6984_t:CDS:2 [Funneliformis caledonium]|uniref:6984_t:CDS:1 n=1 Tax=Funneliformis caledonium TaxID=1117310 RepID=A0A9N9GG13_9GLOM|nr:6984_t:CDS:2 [Funneliformis caledonium]
MDNEPDFIRLEILKKRKSRENETSDQQEKHCAYNHEYKWKKLAKETIEQCETRLKS